MRELQIIYKDPTALRPRSSNPRTHSDKQIRQIADSISQFGFVSPVLVDDGDGIVAGHGRVRAAQLLEMADIPTVCVGHLTPAQIRAYVIADNRLAENAGWDRGLLALELKELSVEVDFDIGVIGFEVAEIDLLIGELDQTAPDAADKVPEIDTANPAVTREGDLWKIGEHFLICGDSTRKETFEALLRETKAAAIFTDPPYNVRVDGNVSGLGKVRHREFAMASGEMTRAQFTAFLKTIFENLVQFSADGSLHYICMDWRHMAEVMDAGSRTYAEFKNLCVWAKTNAGMGSLYRSQHELVFVYKNGTAAHMNNVELGRFGRNRTNLWTYAGANSFGKDRSADLAMHPTVKPTALVADAILDCSPRGGIILDAFAGSGTTLIAAEKTGRCGYGIEIDPHYADTIIRRFVDVYGLKAVHMATERTFDDIARERTEMVEA